MPCSVLRVSEEIQLAKDIIQRLTNKKHCNNVFIIFKFFHLQIAYRM